jgi:CO/xanthine dehydrogenase Mo-binding subunit
MVESFMTVGKSVRRIDAVEKVTGKAKYATDIRLENMLHAKLLRSPYAHARVKHIDTSRAEKLPGVKGIATIEEVPKVVEYWFFLRTEKKSREMFLRDNVVRFIGDPVLAIAAEDEETAEEALSLVQVDYEPLVALLDPFEAMKEEKIKIHRRGNIAFQVTKTYGDIEKGFRDAEIVIENTYRTSKQKHASLDHGTCIADYNVNETDGLLFTAPNWSQMYLSGALGLPVNK